MVWDIDFVCGIDSLRFIHYDWSKFQGRAVYRFLCSTKEHTCNIPIDLIRFQVVSRVVKKV